MIDDEKLEYFWVSLKNLIFRKGVGVGGGWGGGVTKNQYIGGDCLKRGGLDSLQNRFKGELGKKERGGIFEGGKGGGG